MPFWQRSSPEDEQRRMQAQQEAEASRRSLEAGGLPLQATQRLSEEVAIQIPGALSLDVYVTIQGEFKHAFLETRFT